MKIALLDRPDSKSFPGGDTVHIEAIGRYLAQKGICIVKVNEVSPDLQSFDLAILFNFQRPQEIYFQALCAKRNSIPFLIFPIYWNVDKVIPEKDFNVFYVRRMLKKLFPKSFRNFFRDVQFLIRLRGEKSNDCFLAPFKVPTYFSRDIRFRTISDWSRTLIVNSEAEREHLLEEIPEIDSEKIRVILSGLWLDELESVDKLKSVREKCIIYAGGISPRKNQLGLIRAARLLKCPVKIIGQVSVGSKAYAKQVYREAPDNVEFLGPLSRVEVLKHMGRSCVYCQPGFIETPGLSSLEAGAMGCHLVASDVGPVKEYFGEGVTYIDPRDPESIAQGINIALVKTEVDLNFVAFIRSQYEWKHVLRPLDSLIGFLGNSSDT
jgi:glycosyltransferase involved in cell wall biosynthesis